jgi:hypothetical protein
VASTIQDVSRPGDPEDAEIERRMVAAELAGRTTVADALARELEAARKGRMSNVIALAKARQRGV